MTERIMTLHPQGKEGVNIEKAKYEQVKEAIIQILQGQEGMSFKDLGRAVKEWLADGFTGSISWYFTTVKLDLEARGIIERIQQSSPQMLRLTRN